MKFRIYFQQQGEYFLSNERIHITIYIVATCLYKATVFNLFYVEFRSQIRVKNVGYFRNFVFMFVIDILRIKTYV